MDRVVLVTGMSGAGRTTCLKILEDFGFEAVDNIPVKLLGRMIRDDAAEPDRLAIGIDTRTRGFSPDQVLAVLGKARAAGGTCLLFLDCDDEVLRRRFTETRRRHPLADLPGLADAVTAERRLIAPLKAAADLQLDTSELSPPDLRRLLAGRFASDQANLSIAVVSFAYRNGLPREADLVLDVRFLRNPHYVEALRPATGRDRDVQAHVRADPAFEPFLADLKRLLTPLLPRYRSEGKSYLTLAFGCTGGRHRSVCVAELTASWLNDLGWEAITVHRDLDQAAAADTGRQP
jgi:UPF0042 nucleotide-binding protein